MAERRPIRCGTGAAACAGAAALLCIAFSSHASATSFTGRYDGTGSAAGLAMVLSQDGAELHGRIAAAGKDVYLMSGRIAGDAAAGEMTNPGARADFKLEWKPGEIVFTLTPLLADGAENPTAAKQYAFLRGKAASPALANYRVEPPARGESVEVTRFLESYRGWSPKEVAAGYAGLSDLDRSLINDFDHLQADIMYRLCQGGAPRASLMSVSAHQDVDCDTLTSLVDKAQASHQIAAFNLAADDQRGALYSVVACMHDLYSADKCEGVREEPKHAAQDWQSAGRIFADISTYGAKSGALVDEVLETDLADAQRSAARVPVPNGAAPSSAPVSQAAPAPVPEQRPELWPARKEAIAAKPPIPHRRPSTLSPTHDIEAQKVDESLLAGVDQSAVFKPHPPDPSIKTGFGFDLRPSLTDADQSAPALFAGPGAAPAETAEPGSNAVPLPRPKPHRPTSG